MTLYLILQDWQWKFGLLTLGGIVGSTLVKVPSVAGRFIHHPCVHALRVVYSTVAKRTLFDKLNNCCFSCCCPLPALYFYIHHSSDAFSQFYSVYIINMYFIISPVLVFSLTSATIIISVIDIGHQSLFDSWQNTIWSL